MDTAGGNGDRGRLRRMDPDLIVVGDVMIDVAVESKALRRGGDVHGDVRIRPGGTSANAAVWAASLGARVRLHGRVGGDLGGRLLREILAERGVEAELTSDVAAPTGAMLVVREEDERSMVADRGANANLRPDDLPPRLSAGAVLVSGYLLLHAGSQEAARAALDRSSAPWVAIDAASWPLIEDYGPDAFLDVAAGANLVLANEDEARTLTGHAEPDKAAGRLGDRAGGAAIKLGAAGAVLSMDGELLREPSPPVEVVDPTGAGDAFDGVLLASLARGAEPREALRAACAAGARAAASPEPWPP
jgi:ribokinase